MPPAIDVSSPYGRELERRRRLAAATNAFRGAVIRFEPERDMLLAGAEEPLADVRAELDRDPGLALLVKAFADARERAPDALSARRADTVVQWLVARGVDARRLTPRGCGAKRALTFGETESERERNRWAELVRRTATAGCEPPW